MQGVIREILKQKQHYCIFVDFTDGRETEIEEIV